jgi:hypothetical protein
VSLATVAVYEPAARVLLSGWVGRDGLGLERLAAGDVSEFFARECSWRGVSAARLLVTVARSLGLCR